MTTKTFLVPLAIAITALVLIATGDAVWAQADRPKIDPQKCALLQRQMDQIVVISRSTTLTEEQKIAKLSESLTQSLHTMISSTANDPDAAKIAKEWRDTLMRVMSTADVSGRAQDTDVSADAKRGVNLIKKRIQPYIAVMKLLCPDLVVPSAVGR